MGHSSRPYKVKLKHRLFEKHGYLNSEGQLVVECAFGCGDELTWAKATLDRYPIMGQHGGRYEWGNVRLACVECNSRNRNKNSPKVKTRKDRYQEKIERKKRNKAIRKLYEIRQNVEESRSANEQIKMDLK